MNAPKPPAPGTPLDLDTLPVERGASDNPKTPALAPFDPAPLREKVRTQLAIGLAIVTAVIGLVILAAALLKWTSDVNPLLTGIFTPFFGVTGTIFGFYFGGRDPTKH